MALGVATQKSDGIARSESGTIVGDGTILTVTLGYRPQRVVLINVTDAIKFEKHDAGMLNTETLQTVAAGAQSTTTSSQIVITDGGFVVTAAVFITAKVFSWFTN